MASFEIQNWKPGLDTRRYELTSIPGSLETFVNGHINQGGEVEKRKSWQLSGTVNAFTGTFGGQDTPSGIVVFGSAVTPSLPAGYSYQRLQHPAVLNGTVYDGTKHAMTAIVGSCLFGSSAFAVATFADGTSWAYYNGALVVDFTAGLILAYLATAGNTKIASNIQALLAATTNYVGSTTSGVYTDVVGPIGQQYTTNVIETSGAGTLTAQIKNQGLASVPGTQAVGQFQIVAGAAGASNFISIVKIVGAAGQAGTNLLLNGTAINWQTTVFDTAIAVANSISQYAGTTGFYAIASQNTVLIYAVSTGTTTNNLPISVTVNVNATANNFNICIGNCAIAFSGPGNTGVFAVSSITIGGGGDITGGGASTSSMNAMVSNLAKGINAQVGHTYCACAIGNVLYISKAVTSSADTVAAVVVTTGTGVTAGQIGATGLQLSLSTYIDSTALTINSSGRSSGGYFVTSVTGSVQPAPVSVILGGVTNPPYNYQWNLVSVSNSDGTQTNYLPLAAGTSTIYQATIAPNLQQFSSVSFGQIYTGPPKFTASSTYNCTMTDASGNSFTSPNVVITANVTLNTH